MSVGWYDMTCLTVYPNYINKYLSLYNLNLIAGIILSDYSPIYRRIFSSGIKKVETFLSLKSAFDFFLISYNNAKF